MQNTSTAPKFNIAQARVYEGREKYATKMYEHIESLDGRERNEYIAYETDMLRGILVALQGMRA